MSEILATFEELRQWEDSYTKWKMCVCENFIPYDSKRQSNWIYQGEMLVRKLEEFGVDFKLMVEVNDLLNE